MITNNKMAMLDHFGVKLVESPHALAKPKGVPRTDDMKIFVEAMERMGQIRMRPAAYMLNGTFVIHPELMFELKHRITTHLDNQFLGASNGRG